MNIINPMGAENIKLETEFCGRTLGLEVGRVGFRSDASVLVTYGDTVVLGSVVLGKKPVLQDFFPLSVDYEEKFYANGKISGSKFLKREGKPSDDAILIGRLIDRPIRPLFPKGYRQEVQVVTTVLSMDPDFRPDVIAMIAASAALHIAGLPFDGPVAGVRIGLVNGEFKAFLTPEEREVSDLDFVVACRENKVMMVEAGANEVSEETIINAMDWAINAVQSAIQIQKDLRARLNVIDREYTLSLPDESIAAELKSWAESNLKDQITGNVIERAKIVEEKREQLHAEMCEIHAAGADAEEKLANYEENLKNEYDNAFELAVHAEVRRGIVENQTRPDDRKLDEVRPLSSQVGILPRTHGSSLFTRGLTQAMNIVTLAPLSFSQVVDTMEKTDEKRRYMHHYNAPSYTVGEPGRIGAPGRREIGHGYLAERALIPVLPPEEDFPYAIRSVTEIMSQNGSTSMAATCSSCMALMDAGVPLKRPVSGVAMGLMLDGDTPYILTDLMDAEDFAGDMDFKVTGTEKGITALQMDMKVHGIDIKILREAILRSKLGREHILNHMLSVIPAPKATLSPYAPRIEKLMVNPDKIGAIIGKGGEMINKITSETGATVDIEDSGLVTVASNNAETIEKALNWIKSLVEEPEVGKIYTGKVVNIKEFGAFVNIMNGVDGMLHISQISDKRLAKVEDALKVGQEVKVKLVAIDEKGRLSLTMKDVQQ